MISLTNIFSGQKKTQLPVAVFAYRKLGSFDPGKRVNLHVDK